MLRAAEFSKTLGNLSRKPQRTFDTATFFSPVHFSPPFPQCSAWSPPPTAVGVAWRAAPAVLPLSRGEEVKFWVEPTDGRILTVQ